MSGAADVRGYATFLADVPDDQVEEGGEIVKPGGGALGEHLRAAVANRGLKTSAVHQHSFYGWAFEVTVDRVRVWCMIQFADPWLLITEVSATFLDRFFRRRSGGEYETVLSVLRESLGAAPFRSVAWMTRAEYEVQERPQRAD